MLRQATVLAATFHDVGIRYNSVSENYRGLMSSEPHVPTPFTPRMRYIVKHTATPAAAPG